MKISPYRLRARQILTKVMREHAGCTVKEMRKHIRSAFRAAGWEEHVHGQRIRRVAPNIALGETQKVKPPKPMPLSHIIPSMRDWAIANGLVRQKPTTDIWQD